MRARRTGSLVAAPLPAVEALSGELDEGRNHVFRGADLRAAVHAEFPL